MPAGRPTDYSPKIAAQVCARIAEGQSLREIARDPEMPSKTTILRWVPLYPGFRDQYALAMEMRAELLAEDILDIADDGENDWMKRAGQDGESVYVLNGEHVQRSRLRIDSRKWLLSKLLPKKYGEKVTQEHTGKDGAPFQIVISQDDANL